MNPIRFIVYRFKKQIQKLIWMCYYLVEIEHRRFGYTSYMSDFKWTDLIFDAWQRQDGQCSRSTLHEKNNFAEKSKILLDTVLKIILIKIIGTSKIMSNVVKNFDILTTALSVLYNCFDSSTKLLF